MLNSKNAKLMLYEISKINIKYDTNQICLSKPVKSFGIIIYVSHELCENQTFRSIGVTSDRLRLYKYRPKDLQT